MAANVDVLLDGGELTAGPVGVDVGEERLAACRTLCLKYGLGLTFG